MLPRNEIKEDSRHFETRLAFTLAARADLFPVMEKVSQVIVRFVEHNKTKILQNLKDEKSFGRLQTSLYKNEFCALKKIDESLSNDREVVLNDVIFALKEKTDFVVKHAFIQTMALYLLVKPFHDKEFKELSESKGFKEANAVCSNKKKYVVKREGTLGLIEHLGIGTSEDYKKLCENPDSYLQKMLAAISKNEIINNPHNGSIELFKIDSLAEEMEPFITNNLPYLAGPSGHTVSSLAALQVCMKAVTNEYLSQDEVQEYAIALAVFNMTAGFHTFHEVMYVANQCCGVQHDFTSYVHHLPKSVRKDGDFLFQFGEKLGLIAKEHSDITIDKVSPKYITTQLLRYPALPMYKSHLERQSLFSQTVKTCQHAQHGKLFIFTPQQGTQSKKDSTNEDILNLLCYGKNESLENNSEQDELLNSLR